jgi:hypothetical protein
LSAIPELPRSTIIAWRAFVASPAYREGRDHLSRYYCPQAGGANEIELVKSAIGWGAYQQALIDQEEVLTKIKKTERSLDEPSLQAPAGKADEAEDRGDE